MNKVLSLKQLKGNHLLINGFLEGKENVINTSSLHYKKILASLEAPWKSTDIRQNIVAMNKKLKRKIIVLDDDPTGAQTVQNLFVLTAWRKEDILQAFQDDNFIFYILTNTRSYEAKRTEEMVREIMTTISAVAKENGYSFTVINRGDSTLRGHYPLELDVIIEEQKLLLNEQIDAQLIIPAFFEGQRYTYDDVHYIKEDDMLVPVSDTEFSTDKAFGYTNSNLCKWVEEKTQGAIKSSACKSIAVAQLREGPAGVLPTLLAAKNNEAIIVNALCYEDLNVLSYALLEAELQGKKFVYQVAASFVRAYAGIEKKPYLVKEQMVVKGNESHGGLVIVGSHVQKTTNQLNQLFEHSPITAVEVSVKDLLEDKNRSIEINRINKEVDHLIRSGKDAVIYTSRDVIAADDQTSNLQISQKVSGAITEIVQALKIAPKFVIAKGGITSSDVATKGLAIRRAEVIGQAAPGIPVWLTGEEAKFTNIPYIIFPGNVGEDHTLLDIVTRLS